MKFFVWNGEPMSTDEETPNDSLIYTIEGESKEQIRKEIERAREEIKDNIWKHYGNVLGVRMYVKKIPAEKWEILTPEEFWDAVEVGDF